MIRQKQKGMALLVVMLISAIVMSLAASISTKWKAHFTRVSNTISAQTSYWAMAGASQVIRNDFRSTEALTSRKGIITIDAVPVHYAVKPNDTCLNINSLLPSGRHMKDGTYFMPYARKVFLSLLTSTGITSTDAHVIMDKLILSVKTQVDGKATRSFNHPSVLSVIINDADRVSRLMDMLCVTSDTRITININALSQQHAPLLAALFTGSLSVEEARNLITSRPEKGWSASSDLSMLINKTAQQKLSDVTTLTTTSTNKATLLLWVENGILHVQKSLLVKTEDGVTFSDIQSYLSEEIINAINET